MYTSTKMLLVCFLNKPMLLALSIYSNILKLSSLYTSSFSVKTKVCLGVLLPVNSVHMDVPLLSTALV